MQINILHDCIRSIIYFRYIADIQPTETARIYIKDVLADHVVQSWCKIFGQYSEDTHWKNIAEISEITVLIEPYRKQVILDSISMSETEWKNYHTSMLVARNEFFAHFDMRSLLLHYPDLNPALASAISYREWLSSLLNEIIRSGEVIINNTIPTNIILEQFKNEAMELF